MSGTGAQGAKRKNFKSGDYKEKAKAQKKAKTTGGGNKDVKGVDYITITHKNEREDFSIGDCILVQSDKKKMPYVRLLLSPFWGICGSLTPCILLCSRASVLCRRVAMSSVAFLRRRLLKFTHKPSSYRKNSTQDNLEL
jgi:hypothetical protein